MRLTSRRVLERPACGSFHGSSGVGMTLGSGANLEMRSYRVSFRNRGLRMSKLRRVEELFAGRHSSLNDLEVLACQRGVAFSYLDIGMAN